MPLVTRADSVLVVVDTQPGFVSHDSRDDNEKVVAAATFERLAWLAGMAALLEIPAVVVEEGRDRNGPTERRVLERLPPASPVLGKTTFGLAAESEIVDAIRATGRNTTVLVGFETDVCVAQSAIDLRDLHFRAIVVEDAVYSVHELQHQRGLARMTQAGVESNHCKGLVFEWLHEVRLADDVFRTAEERFGKPPPSL